MINNLFQRFEALCLQLLLPDLETFVHFFFTHPLGQLIGASYGDVL